MSRDHTFWARDLDFQTVESAKMNRWVDWITQAFNLDPKEKKYIHRRFVCLHDDIASMICQQMTQVITKNRVNSHTGVVAEKALWNEELVPVDTFFLIDRSIK